MSDNDLAKIAVAGLRIVRLVRSCKQLRVKASYELWELHANSNGWATIFSHFSEAVTRRQLDIELQNLNTIKYYAN